MKEKLLIAYHAFMDKRTPWFVKAGLFLLVAYILSPIDLIPDFIPVIGLLDELILVPVAFSMLYPFIPEEVKQDCCNINNDFENKQLFKIPGMLIVMTLWLLMIILFSYCIYFICLYY